LIGYMGSTGQSSGPHLHYHIWKDGVNVNPLEYGAMP
jgi:murein DD-endopeptidase MepM/ murein hydrolase activator NlpD